MPEADQPVAEKPEPRVFELGLVAAGAISAGAYTAGVLDFLFQALAEWEKAIEREDANENHRVRIAVISGASAGAATGGLGAIALADRLSVPEDSKDPVPVPFLPKLHEAWVIRPRMLAEDGNCLLGVQDFAAGGKVKSLLDTTVLEDIAKGVLQGGKPLRRVPWIADPLHVYMAVGNLRGVPYVLECTGADSTYRHCMTMHADHMHFAVTGLGTSAGRLPGAQDGLLVDTLNLPSMPGRTDRWWLFASSALASSAFPIGLSARALEREDKAEYDVRPWHLNGTTVAIAPDWPKGMPKEYGFVNVDGGVFNNEPFEFARQILSGGRGIRNAQHPVLADRAVLLIDPFPDDPGFPLRDPMDTALVKALPALLSSWMQQARFKPEQLALALEETVYSRFVIAPRRVLEGNKDPERFALASGLLSGFGGFLSQEFREADYQLGRRNCQAFLKKSLVFPTNNYVICGQETPDVPRDTPTPAETKVPLIPLYGSASPEVPLVADWPKFPSSQLDKLQDAIAQRATQVVPRLIQQNMKNPMIRWALKLIWRFFGNDGVAKAARQIIQADLIKRGQIDGQWDFEHQDQRDVFAALCEPGWDLRTLEGLAKTTRLKPDRVYDILAKHPYLWAAHKTKLGAKGYTLQFKDRSWLARKFIPASVDNGQEGDTLP